MFTLLEQENKKQISSSQLHKLQAAHKQITTKLALFIPNLCCFVVLPITTCRSPLHQTML
jgi:formate hydrogenlyase subunit 4